MREINRIQQDAFSEKIYSVTLTHLKAQIIFYKLLVVPGLFCWSEI